MFADTPEEAEQVASDCGMGNKRPDGSWGDEATVAHAQLCKDMQAAFRVLASHDNEAVRSTLSRR